MTVENQKGWFIIIYKVPSSPSTARVTVWKKTKEMGALPLQQSVYILPNLQELKGALDQLKEQIQQFGGESRVIEITSLEQAQEKEIIDGFNRLRNQEYEEVLGECEDFFREIERESEAKKFYFAEMEEIDKRLQGLKGWFDVIAERDFFGGDIREKTSNVLKECRDKFDIFSQEVFSREEVKTQSNTINITGINLRGDRKEKKGKIQESCSKDQLIARLKEIVSKLEGNRLSIGKETVGTLPEKATLELRYKNRGSMKSLGIEIEWQELEKGEAA